MASLATMGLLGDKLVLLTSGTPEAGPVEEGAVIVAERYLEIGDIMSEVRPALENIEKIVGNVSNFLTSLDTPVAQIEKLLTSASQIAEQRFVREPIAKIQEIYASLAPCTTGRSR